MRAALSLALVVALAGAGCATILAPGPDEVLVTSVPPGARVELDGVAVGFTPCVVLADRGGDGVLVLRRREGPPIEVHLTSVANGWFFGNLLLGGVVGMGVDLIAGNVTRWSGDEIQVDFLATAADGP